MEKGGKILRKKRKIFSEEEVIFLKQLVDVLEEAGLKLEETYNKKDYESFDKLKKFILEVQGKISDMIK
jgi:hypothetical protein